jgi:hypothetical protein
MLSVSKFPYTGPFFPPGHPDGPSRNRPTIKGLKRGMIRLGYLDQELGTETDDFGSDLAEAMRAWWREEGGAGAFKGYGRGSWLLLRDARLVKGPNKGQFAMDALALSLVREDALSRVHPIAGTVKVEICQGPHNTEGLLGNWALDFCCRAGSRVVAVERGTIRKLSGHDPKTFVDQKRGIFGWSIHYQTSAGYWYFTTHYGERVVREGQVVDVGELIGKVGAWPDDPGRSHLHQGVTSPLGAADAKRRMEEVAAAPRISGPIT